MSGKISFKQPPPAGAPPWYDRIRQSREKFECPKLAGMKLGGVTFYFVIRSVYRDFFTLLRTAKKVFGEIKLYGDIIKKSYGVSKLKQAKQQLYLTLVVGVAIKHYRAYLLFMKDRWKYVDRFTYENYPVQMALVDKTYPDEKPLFDDKLAFYRHCCKNDIPTASIVSIFEEGKQRFINHSNRRLPAKSIFIKDLLGRRGQGAAKYRFIDGKYIDGAGISFNKNNLIQKISKDSLKKNIIIQNVCENHIKWQCFTSGALATCRVLTARHPHSEAIVAITATLRMPVGHADTDNTTTGGIASALDLENGKLSAAIRKKPYEENFILHHHPDTGKQITGTVLPEWKPLVETAIHAHKTFNTIFIGWDIAYTDEGFKVIEGNIGWSARVVESPQKRPLVNTRFPNIFDAWMNE